MPSHTAMPSAPATDSKLPPKIEQHVVPMQVSHFAHELDLGMQYSDPPGPLVHLEVENVWFEAISFGCKQPQEVVKNAGAREHGTGPHSHSEEPELGKGQCRTHGRGAYAKVTETEAPGLQRTVTVKNKNQRIQIKNHTLELFNFDTNRLRRLGQGKQRMEPPRLSPDR